jgi:hypothetical protein
MPKIPITRQELATKVLSEIRQHHGCQSVREIAIRQVDVWDAGTTWHVNVIDSGDVGMKLAYLTARREFENVFAF